MSQNRKGNSKLLGLLILGLIVALIAAGTYWFGTQKTEDPKPTTSASATPTPTNDGWIEYDRDAFPHWETASVEYGFSGALGNCDVRDAALIRDAQAVQILDSQRCNFDGYWVSPYGECLSLEEFTEKGILLTEISDSEIDGCYDGYYLWYTNSSNPKDFDVDHIVSLEDACNSGACSPEWDEDMRRAFANDSENVLVVGLSTNRSKGSKTLSEWVPFGDFACEYADRYMAIKKKYDLTISDEDQEVYEAMQGTCEDFVATIPNPTKTPPAPAE